MDKKEFRRRRLALLINSHYQGNAAAFARIADVHPSYATRMLYPAGKPAKKAIAEDMVEKIEINCKTPKWFEQSQPHLASVADSVWNENIIATERKAKKAARRQRSTKVELIAQYAEHATAEQQDELLKFLRTQLHAKDITEGITKTPLRTVSNDRIEKQFGLPSRKKADTKVKAKGK